jgi:hypothetical protein
MIQLESYLILCILLSLLSLSHSNNQTCNIRQSRIFFPPSYVIRVTMKDRLKVTFDTEPVAITNILIDKGYLKSILSIKDYGTILYKYKV